mgnify:CR=1 FL=1
MKNFFDKIKEKINRTINPEDLILIDNTKFHKKHKSFDPKKFHLKLIIKSQKLRKMNKIDAHKEIFSILEEEMKYKIHALEIEIN